MARKPQRIEVAERVLSYATDAAQWAGHHYELLDGMATGGAGYRASVRGSGSLGKGDHSDPVLSLVVAGRPDAAETLRSKLQALMKAAAALGHAVQALQAEVPEIVIRERAAKENKTAELVNREVVSLDCMVCGERPRRKRGMCETDYRAWTRAGMPDVARFRHDRLHRHAADVEEAA